MAARQPNPRNSFNKEKILLACIPVIGAIIISFFNTGIGPWITKFIYKQPETNINTLKARGGRVNDMIVFKRYNDISQNMYDGLKPIVTEEKFNYMSDSTEKTIGKFVKPIDTTYSVISGNEIISIKNQYESGTTINQVLFDQQGKIIGLFSDLIPNKRNKSLP